MGSLDVSITTDIITLDRNDGMVPEAVSTQAFIQNFLNNSSFIDISGLLPPNLRYFSDDYKIDNTVACDVVFEFPPAARLVGFPSTDEHVAIFLPWISVFATVVFDPASGSFTFLQNFRFFISETQIFNKLTDVRIFDLYQVDDSGYVSSPEFYDMLQVSLNLLVPKKANVISLEMISEAIKSVLFNVQFIDLESPRWNIFLDAHPKAYLDWCSGDPKLSLIEKAKLIARFNPGKNKSQQEGFAFNLSMFPVINLEDVIDGLSSRQLAHPEFHDLDAFIQFYRIK